MCTYTLYKRPLTIITYLVEGSRLAFSVPLYYVHILELEAGDITFGESVTAGHRVLTGAQSVYELCRVY